MHSCIKKIKNNWDYYCIRYVKDDGIKNTVTKEIVLKALVAIISSNS
ncbi:hypothetical protein NMT12_50037 [metagenome]